MLTNKAALGQFLSAFQSHEREAADAEREFDGNRMKRIDIVRMMKIPSSVLSTILEKRKTLESACRDGNLSIRKQI
ncbi:hypothetical protein T4E_1498 [Trichinella pseudospiralis]|uniref:HTH psq-type domain-containing protein n=1 Tax=Trichinella pseudospiralis TaxID=6337 RepID=A0A0V0YLM8_TRIPS|nr:hypothetical protein T4E_1498 [Trichinella pseudospiralis]